MSVGDIYVNKKKKKKKGKKEDSRSRDGTCLIVHQIDGCHVLTMYMYNQVGRVNLSMESRHLIHLLIPNLIHVYNINAMKLIKTLYMFPCNWVYDQANLPLSLLLDVYKYLFCWVKKLMNKKDMCLTLEAAFAIYII